MINVLNTSPISNAQSRKQVGLKSVAEGPMTEIVAKTCMAYRDGG